MKCPNCSVNLVMSDRSGIEIDYCPECRGVWLDRGELDKIIERSIPTSKNNNFENKREEEYYSKDQNNYKKKKSILGDLFDF